jgi:hypothetical protein|tara:strand:+ start:239 stop:880 length:642 start_codon:yes stop_codon:yes gene_type:complete
MKSKILAENIVKGSGGHGLKQDQLVKIFDKIDNLEDFAYTLKKVIEHGGKDYLTTQSFSNPMPAFDTFTRWHHIDEKYDPSWGFDKKDAGCYMYGMFKDSPPEVADILQPGIIYIGESRATTRNCMLGRRTDFKGSVRNVRLSPYGCGTAFTQKIGKEYIDNVYQAYLPMHNSLVKEAEMQMLIMYYRYYGRIPVCNPDSDLRRVELRIKNEN